MTKSKQIIELLKDGTWHNMRELNAICFRYTQRNAEINKKLYPKYEIVNKRTSGNQWWYRLQPMGLSLDEPVIVKKVKKEEIKPNNHLEDVRKDIQNLEKYTNVSIQEPLPRMTSDELRVDLLKRGIIKAS